MNAQDITTIIGGIAALATAIGLPTYLSKRKASALTPAGVAQMFKDERDRLQARLDELEARHDAELAAVEAKARVERAEAQSQIAQLRIEVDSLYRRLYHAPPTP